MKYKVSRTNHNRYQVQFSYRPSNVDRGTAVIAKVLDPEKSGKILDYSGTVKGQHGSGISLIIEVSAGEVIVFGFSKKSSENFTAANRAIVREDASLIFCDRNYARFYTTSNTQAISGEKNIDGRQIITVRYPIRKENGLPFIARVDGADFQLSYDGGTILLFERYYNCVVMAKPGDIVVYGHSDPKPDQSRWNLCIVRHDLGLQPITRAAAELHLG